MSMHKKITIRDIKKAITTNDYEKAIETFISMVEDKKVNIPSIPADSPQNVFEAHLRYAYGHKRQEHFICLALNSRNEVIDSEALFKGTINECLTHPREVFRFAMMNNAASVIIAHNHPSKNLTPSAEDKALTKRMMEAGKIVGICVLDHIVFCSNGYISMREEGDMTFL